jgi:hypothetical protein
MIVRADGPATLICSVRDLTALGAGLEVAGGDIIPSSFQLTLDRGHTYRACRLVWRHKGRLGLEFAR